MHYHACRPKAFYSGSRVAWQQAATVQKTTLTCFTQESIAQIEAPI
jgi:hypothetical protein